MTQKAELSRFVLAFVAGFIAVKAVIRLVNENDVLPMLVIYAPIVQETAISFELESPSETEFQQRIKSYQQQMPWLVCEINQEVVGYAYARPYHTRAAYQWSVESSVYVSANYRRKGIAKALYRLHRAIACDSCVSPDKIK